MHYKNIGCALLNANGKQEHQEVSCQGGAAGRITHSQQHVTAGNLKKNTFLRKYAAEATTTTIAIDTMSTGSEVFMRGVHHD